jgi:hypothetical protein
VLVLGISNVPSNEDGSPTAQAFADVKTEVALLKAANPKLRQAARALPL